MDLNFLPEFLEDESIPPNEKVDHLLVALRNNQSAMEEVAAPFRAIIEAEQAKLGKIVVGHEMAEGTLKKAIWGILEEHYPDERHDSEAGRAQIVRPKNRILFDIHGLETLRKSSDEVERMIGHLRQEKLSKPYLKVKLK